MEKYENERYNFVIELYNEPMKTLYELYKYKNGKYFSNVLILDNLCCYIDEDIGKNNEICKLVNIKVLEGKDNEFKVGNFKLKTSYNNKLECVYDYKKDMSNEQFNNVINQLKLCGFEHNDDVIYVGSDQFTNNMIISYLIEYVMKTIGNEYGFDNIIKLYTISICSKEEKSFFGVNINQFSMKLEEYMDLGYLIDIQNDSNGFFNQYLNPIYIDTLNNKTKLLVLDHNIILNIILQVLITLSFLQDNMKFIHGTLSINNIGIKLGNLNVNYKKNINSNFICKICNFDLASISVELSNGIHRFYNNSWLSTNYLAISPFVGHDNSEEPYYIIKNGLSIEYYIWSLQMGYPYYPTIDTYIFIISFMMLPSIFYGIMKNDYLREKIWKKLWFEQDENIIYSKFVTLIENKTIPTFKNVFPLLQNIKLKCNITDILLSDL